MGIYSCDSFYEDVFIFHNLIIIIIIMDFLGIPYRLSTDSFAESSDCGNADLQTNDRKRKKAVIITIMINNIIIILIIMVVIFIPHRVFLKVFVLFTDCTSCR